MLKSLDRRQLIKIVGGGALLVLAACQEQPQAAGENQVAPGKLPERPDDVVLGDPKAPVQIVEYASMTCTHCAAFAVGDAKLGKPAVFPELKAKYIDTGKVRYVFREFPLDGFALAASLAMRCAVGTNAERYLALADLIFSRQNEWAFSTREGDQIKENLANLMREAGLGRAQFDACVADEAGLARVRAVQSEAVDSFSINSTPAFIINGAKYVGELEFKRFEEILAPLLKSS